MRTKRTFGELDAADLLEAIRRCRAACVRAQAKAPIHSPGARVISDALRVLDDLAECLTGDVTILWAKPHKTPPNGRA